MGLSFYGYIILTRILRGGEQTAFKAIFWVIIVIVAALRLIIAVYHGRFITQPSDYLQVLISHLHIGYFTGIALVECITSALLLKHLASALRSSKGAALRGGLLKYLLLSTEIRVTILSLISISRTVTHGFLIGPQSAAKPAVQFDRFAATLEILFPIVM